MQDGKAKEIKSEYLALQAEYTALDTPARKAKIKEYLARLNARLRAAQDVTALFCFLTKNCFCARFTQKKNGSYLCSWGEFTAFDSDNFDRAADFLQSADITISNGDYENALSTAGPSLRPSSITTPIHSRTRRRNGSPPCIVNWMRGASY